MTKSGLHYTSPQYSVLHTVALVRVTSPVLTQVLFRFPTKALSSFSGEKKRQAPLFGVIFTSMFGEKFEGDASITARKVAVGSRKL